MKPGAAVEVVEEDLNFPGWSEDDESEVDTLSNISRHRDSNGAASSSTGSERKSSNASGSSSAFGSTSSTSDYSTNSITTSAKPKSVAIDAKVVDQPSISISLPTDTSIPSSSNFLMQRSVSLRQPVSIPNVPESRNRPSTATAVPTASYQSLL